MIMNDTFLASTIKISQKSFNFVLCKLQARGLLLVKWSFRVWRVSTDRQRAYRLRQQEIADNFYRDTATRKAWVVWLRRYRVEDWAR